MNDDDPAPTIAAPSTPPVEVPATHRHSPHPINHAIPFVNKENIIGTMLPMPEEDLEALWTWLRTLREEEANYLFGHLMLCPVCQKILRPRTATALMMNALCLGHEGEEDGS